MAYVTEDDRVKNIVNQLRRREIDHLEAAEQIKELGFLEWEVAEAIGINK